ncbi:MAG: non-canonical purine NTP diphosphatase [Bacteroidales bacterium]|nr:non-canonical purine NTP diphosphatase [Bacteroidales bacterium]
MKLVLASNNKHKLEEMRAILGGNVEVVSLADINCHDEIPEEQDTIEGNALQKARYIHDKFGVDCFADDTGLEVDCLNGEPGVYSARYAGENVTFSDNINKLLANMKGQTNRNAKFRTAIALILGGSEYIFEGEVKGRIIEEYRGSNGFGYDPVFMPDGYGETFAELSAEIKNNISHRGNAAKKLAEFLKGK